MAITDIDTEDAGGASETSEAPGSVAAFLRAKREQIVHDGPAELELDVPGYEGALVVTYRYPEGGSDPVVQAVNRAQNSKERGAIVSANADLLVACCYEVRGRLPAGDLEPLDPDPSDGPVRFSKRLARLLEIDVPDDVKAPARFVCRNVFSPQAAATGVYDGDVALMVQGGEVVQFLSKAEAEVSERFVGE